NNATHELDVARWALQVDFPSHAHIEAGNRQYENDGWDMYDSMEATFNFPEEKIIQWDGKSRNGYSTYGAGRGTIIYGSEGTVFVDRGRYEHTDLGGKIIKEVKAGSDEAGTALGGGGDTSTAHVVNFFNTIRGSEKLQAPIDDAAVSMAMVHYINMAYRAGKGFDIDEKTGKVYDREAMRFWGREYENGWEPSV
ncbi:MAG: gfo/Idh/MocA family oxidoreductase, partial [Leeuwenhoekiella sp.]